MTAEQPLVSVVVPAYRHETYVTEALNRYTIRTTKPSN